MTAATLADGQLAASSASILAANNAAGLSEDRVVNAIFCNTSASNTEVVILTLTRAGGTARRVTRASLAPNESLYVRGLAMGPADVLAGYATLASSRHGLSVFVQANHQVALCFGRFSRCRPLERHFGLHGSPRLDIRPVARPALRHEPAPVGTECARGLLLATLRADFARL